MCDCLDPPWSPSEGLLGSVGSRSRKPRHGMRASLREECLVGGGRGGGDRSWRGPGGKAGKPDGIIPASVWLEGGSSRRLGGILLTSWLECGWASDSVTLHPQNPMSLQTLHIITPREVRRLWGTRASRDIYSGPTIVPRAKRRCFLGDLSNEVLRKGMGTLRFCPSHSSQGHSPSSLHRLTLPLQAAQAERDAGAEAPAHPAHGNAFCSQGRLCADWPKQPPRKTERSFAGDSQGPHALPVATSSLFLLLS